MVLTEGSWSHCREARKPSLGKTGAARGFTLLEILLALAVIGLLAAALTTVSWHLLDDRAKTPQDTFWEASREARKLALKNERETRLSYDDKQKSFVITDGITTKSFPLPPIRDLTVDFLAAPQGKSFGSVLIGGELVDTRTIPAVSYYSDGTCQPFRVQFRSGGPARVLAIDPWTCAEVIKNDDNTY